jgi:hypothetical protein
MCLTTPHSWRFCLYSLFSPQPSVFGKYTKRILEGQHHLSRLCRIYHSLSEKEVVKREEEALAVVAEGVVPREFSVLLQGILEVPTSEDCTSI